MCAQPAQNARGKWLEVPEAYLDKSWRHNSLQVRADPLPRCSAPESWAPRTFESARSGGFKTPLELRLDSGEGPPGSGRRNMLRPSH